MARGISSTGTFISTATADNATASATKTNVNNVYIAGISGSFSAAAIKTLTLKIAGSTVGTFHIHNSQSIQFDPAILATGDVTAELAASGTPTVIGAVNLWGYAA